MSTILVVVMELLREVHLGDIATWVTGIATIALFIVALKQIRTERDVRQDRDIRSQAELVSAWIVREELGLVMIAGEREVRPVAWVAVNNESKQPIYQAIVRLVAVGQGGDSIRGESSENQVCISIVPPGRGYLRVLADYGGMHRLPAIEIGFQDAKGQAWIRRPWGELEPIAGSTLAHYEVLLPTGWDALVQQLPDEEDVGAWLDNEGAAAPGSSENQMEDTANE